MRPAADGVAEADILRFLFALLALAVTLVPITAEAAPPSDCGATWYRVDGILYQVGVWLGGCTGVGSWANGASCSTLLHTGFGGVHASLVSGSGCWSGVWLP